MRNKLILDLIKIILCVCKQKRGQTHQLIHVKGLFKVVYSSCSDIVRLKKKCSDVPGISLSGLYLWLPLICFVCLIFLILGKYFSKTGTQVQKHLYLTEDFDGYRPYIMELSLFLWFSLNCFIAEQTERKNLIWIIDHIFLVHGSIALS